MLTFITGVGDFHSVFNSLEDIFQMPASISQKTGRWINFFEDSPTLLQFLKYFQHLDLTATENLEPTAVEWGRDPKVNHHIEGHGSESGAWNLRLLSWRFRRQHSVVTVVYKGCYYRYAFAFEKLEACGWGVCRMVEVPHRQHHMDLHNRLEMGCAERRSMFSLKTSLRSGGWDNANQMNTKTAAPVNPHKLCILDQFNCLAIKIQSKFIALNSLMICSKIFTK